MQVSIDRLLSSAHLDLEPADGPPSAKRMVAVTSLVVVAALGVDVALAHLATGLWHQLRDYGHFQFGDYGTLTVLGVVPACVAWPVVVRVTSRPRRFFVRLAVAVTLLLWLPDLWLLVLSHDPVRAVGTLMAMHLAVALIAYNGLVRLAPPRRRAGTAPRRGIEDLLKPARITLFVMASLEFVSGAAVLLAVPFGRPNGFIPKHDGVVYLVHAGVGGVLGVAAVTMLVVSWHRSRGERIGALVGVVGIAFGAVGGVMSEMYTLRRDGMGLMFIGAALAFAGYLATLVEASPAGGATALAQDGLGPSGAGGAGMDHRREPGQPVPRVAGPGPSTQ